MLNEPDLPRTMRSATRPSHHAPYHSPVSGPSREAESSRRTERRAPANGFYPNGQSFLYHAIENGDEGEINYLLGSGADPAQQNLRSHNSPIHAAVERGETSVLLAVLRHLPSDRPSLWNAPNERGETPLYIAARSNKLDLVKALLRYRQVDPNRICRIAKQATAADDSQHPAETTALDIALELKHDGCMVALAAAGAVDTLGRTALHLAIEHDMKTLLRPLLSVSAPARHRSTAENLLNRPDLRGATPLIYASRHHRLKATKKLVRRNVCLTLKDGEGRTALHVAVERLCKEQAHDAVVDTLIDAAKKHEVLDELLQAKDATEGKTPFLKCVELGNVACADTLLEHRARLGETDGKGRNALHIAAASGSEAMLDLVLDHARSQGFLDDMINQRDTDSWGTPLLAAVASGQLPRVEKLMAANADITKTDAHGRGAIYYAVKHDAEDILQVLLEAGGNTGDLDYMLNPPKTPSGEGETTPLLLAVELGHGKYMERLIAEGAALPATDRDGRNALHLAMESSHFHLLPPLLDAAAKSNELKNMLDTRDAEGQTPLSLLFDMVWQDDLALQKKSRIDAADAEETEKKAIKEIKALIAAFVEAGADISIRDENGNNLVQIGLQNGNFYAVSALLEHAENKQVLKELVNARDQAGRTPFLCIASYRSGKDPAGRQETERRACIRMLAISGAETTAQDNAGKNALHYFIEGAELELARAFIKVAGKGQFAEKIIGAKDSNGATPMLSMARHKLEEHIRYLKNNGTPGAKARSKAKGLRRLCIDDLRLADRGASLLETDGEGKNVLHHLLDNSDPAFAHVLLNEAISIHGRDAAERFANARDVHGSSPLDHALRYGLSRGLLDAEHGAGETSSSGARERADALASYIDALLDLGAKPHDEDQDLLARFMSLHVA